MKLAFVSTMNRKLYDFYGKNFLQDFAKFSSKDIKLYIIFEGEYPEEALHIGTNVIIIPLISPEHQSFMKKFGHLEEAKGLRINVFKEDGQRKINFQHDLRYDAVRFSFKPFAIHQSLNYIPDDLDYLIWTDADLRCKKNFKEEDLIQFMPQKNQIMSYLGRKDAYSECGFLGFNIKNEDTKNFINRVIDVYHTGEIFSYAQWHDSFIWDVIRIVYENQLKMKFKDISGDGFIKSHVYINTGLDEFFDHLKGPQRKEAGKSFEEDYSKLVY
jgi:hypothetical protein